jgi:hypothetical protein
MMKMLEMQVGQHAGQPMGDKEEFPRQPQGPKMAKATQTHSKMLLMRFAFLSSSILFGATT